MMSRPVGVALLALGCLSAAGVGAYFSVQPQAAAPAPIAAPVAPAAVSETEALVAPKVEPTTELVRAVEVPAPAAERPRSVPARREAPVVTKARPEPLRDVAVAAGPAPAAEPPAVVETPIVAEPPAPRAAPRAEDPAPQPAPTARYEEIVIPSAAIVGLEIDTALSTERARIEDRVDARVARDVYSDGRLVIPAGSRVVGAVTTVERGGKVKERARLGLRFHTLVLADGRQLELRTDTIFREGESPANDSSKKIGGGAVGGAVLGAIMGGKKGAVLGGIAGAAGGTAAVMAGDRHAATLAPGTVLNVRLSAPLVVEVERR